MRRLDLAGMPDMSRTNTRDVLVDGLW